MNIGNNITKTLLSASLFSAMTLSVSASEPLPSQPMSGGTPLESEPTLSWTAEEGSVSLSGSTMEALPPLDCDLPPDVYNSGDNIPPATVYEYIMDEKGNYILVDDQGRPVPIDEEMTYIPPLEDMIYPQNSEYPHSQEDFFIAFDDNGMVIESGTGDLLSDAFDPEGEPMPEGAFASPMTPTPEPEPEKANWFVTLFQKFLSLFSK